MVDKNIIIEMFFQDESFEVTWMEMKQEYEILGFQDKLTDDERIAEYKYIKQELRKYKFSKQDQILNHDSIENMAKEVESLIGKAAEYSDTRKGIVYNFMRDHWLINLYNQLMRFAMMEDNVEEDEDE